MKSSTVKIFGIFIIILSIVTSIITFLGILLGPIFLILGLPFGWAYYKKGKTSSNINKLVGSSVWVSGIASLLLLTNLGLMIFIIISYFTSPGGSENYTHIILFSLASVPIAVLYSIGLLLLLFGWKDKNSQSPKQS